MLDEIEIPYNEETLTVKIIRSARRTLGLEVKPGPQVLVRAPYDVTDHQIRELVDSRQEWIVRKCDKVTGAAAERRKSGAPPAYQLTEEERDQIAEKIEDRVRYYCQVMQLQITQLRIGCQTTIWGSCTNRRHISLNYQLYYLPDALLDYVVVHELSHCRHLDHSKAFWQEVERYCPDYRNCERQLKKYTLI